MASPALIPKKLNVDIDAILASLQVPVVADADFVGFSALYVRVSTTDQGERYSPSTQLRQLLLKAARDGYRVRRDHIFIDTHTGKIANRPAFDAMKALVKRGGVKAVLIYNVDRLARKTLDALTLATEFKRYGAKLDFVETPYEDSAYGRFTFTQMSAVAELIGEKIVTDSKRGREEAMDEGWLPHRTPCYGYKCLSKREVLTGLSRPRWILENGKRVAAPANERHPQLLLLGDAKMEAAVHLAFALADQGRSLYSIANHLNEAGILTAGKPGQHEAGLWGTVSVGQLLRNPTYIGRHSCAGRVFLCDQLIEEALFHRVQAKMDVTKAALVGRPALPNRYLLRGLLWCGADGCGRRWKTSPGVMRSGNAYPFYICGNIEYRPYRRRCHVPQVRCDLFERVVWDAIWNDVLVPERLLKMAEAYYAAMEQPDNAVTRKAERELEKLTTGLRNVERALADGNMEYTAETSADMKAKKARIAAITAELGSSRRVAPLPPRHVAEAAVGRIRRGPEPSTVERRRSILDGFEELRMTYLDGEVTIEGRVPMPTDLAASGKKNGKGGTPIPSARVSTTTLAKSRALARMRTEYRTSVHRASTVFSHPAPRISSFTDSMLPISTRAARCASEALMPACILRSAEALRKAPSSSSISCSALRRSRSALRPPENLLQIGIWPQHASIMRAMAIL